LVDDVARLQTHPGRGQEAHVERHQADAAAQHAGEVAERGVADDQEERQDVEPGQERSSARCSLAIALLMFVMAPSTSASVRVRSGLRKVKAKATLFRPGGS